MRYSLRRGVAFEAKILYPERDAPYFGGYTNGGNYQWQIK
jgi:hypothetical protein